MPNAETHKTLGALAGFVSLLLLPPLSPTAGTATLIGRIAGGAAGGLLPDRLEPATNPRHRRTCHSATVGGAALSCVDAARRLETFLENKSAELRRAASGQSDAVSRFLLNFAAWITEFLGSAAVGVVAGYISHLAADLRTPAGIPAV